jgi:hypothetical protein
LHSSVFSTTFASSPWRLAQITHAKGKEGKQTESIHGDTRIVDDEVYTPTVRAFQMVGERTHTRTICDVQGVEFNVREAAVGFQGGGLGELRVVQEGLDGCFATGLVAGCEIWGRNVSVDSSIRP